MYSTYTQRIEIALLSDPWCIQITLTVEHKYRKTEEYTQFGVVRYFAEYFTSVKNGNHVLFREFSYIKIGKNGDLLAMSEYSSLLQLLCPDFPTEMVQNAARIVLIDDATDCLMSFSDFIYSFQIQFYYEEFVESVSVIYQDLLSGKNPNTIIVPRSAANEEPDAQEGVDSSIFCECIEGLCERFKHKFPSTVAIKEILESSQRVSFYVNQDIGALPNKLDLLIDPEMDQELERLIAQVAISPTSNNSSSSAVGQKEMSKKASPRKSLHQRKRIEMESNGSTEETDSSEN
uniref:Centriolar satellite-associated tubulin polyglutamylase complex regulator 1 n=1 Tax=Sinocyclocheilus anshuiensis TaxID=1608454 RepID=A0A671SXV0_9TELE